MKSHTITEKENALRAITGSGDPQWVPIISDFAHFFSSSVILERPVGNQDGKDWFGCSWHYDSQCLGYAPDLKVPYILEDITEWRDVITFPDLDAIDWEAAATEDLKDVDCENKLLYMMFETGPMERINSFMGLENALVAMLEEPDEYKALADAIADYKIRLVEKVAEYYKPDLIFAQDDLGTAKGPMISLETYRMLLKPAHTRISKAIRSHGMIHTHHSCGNMEAFIDDLVETGAQVLNPFQECNNWKQVVERHAGKNLCFEVGPAVWSGQPDAAEEEMREEIRRIIDIFGPTKRLTLFGFPTNVNCLKNMSIFLDEARRYGAECYK